MRIIDLKIHGVDEITLFIITCLAVFFSLRNYKIMTSFFGKINITTT